MKILIVLFTTFLFIDGISFTWAKESITYEFAKNKSGKKKTKNKLTWKKFHAICGSGNESRQKNFDKVKGRVIFWVGKVADISKDMALTGNRKWCEEVIKVKMDPSGSFLSDIKLKIPKNMNDKLMTFEKDQYVAFKGKIMYLGTKLSDHVVEVEKFKKMKPKPKNAPPK